MSRIRLEGEDERDADKYSAILILAKIQLSFLNSSAGTKLVPREKKMFKGNCFPWSRKVKLGTK
jgi:hypothetical protein